MGRDLRSAIVRRHLVFRGDHCSHDVRKRGVAKLTRHELFGFSPHETEERDSACGVHSVLKVAKQALGRCQTRAAPPAPLVISGRQLLQLLGERPRLCRSSGREFSLGPVDTLADGVSDVSEPFFAQALHTPWSGGECVEGSIAGVQEPADRRRSNAWKRIELIDGNGREVGGEGVVAELRGLSLFLGTDGVKVAAIEIDLALSFGRGLQDPVLPPP